MALLEKLDSVEPPKKPEKPAADPHAPWWLKLVPMLTGVLAGMGGYLTIRSTNLSNDAIYMSSQATLQQDQASDRWSQMQANSIKANVNESLTELASQNPAIAEKLAAKAKAQRDREPDLVQAAKDAETKRDDDLKGGHALLKEKDLLGYAGIAVQLGIALASVAALVKSKQSFYGAVLCGLIGAGTIGTALFYHFFGH